MDCIDNQFYYIYVFYTSEDFTPFHLSNADYI